MKGLVRRRWHWANSQNKIAAHRNEPFDCEILRKERTTRSPRLNAKAHNEIWRSININRRDKEHLQRILKGNIYYREHVNIDDTRLEVLAITLGNTRENG